MDDADEDTPGALRPKVLYSVAGGVVTTRVRLSSGENTVSERTLIGRSGELPALANQIAAAILDMAATGP